MPQEFSPMPRLYERIISRNQQQQPKVLMQCQPKQIFVKPLPHKEAKVMTQASTSKIKKGLSTLPLYTPHFLEEGISLQLLQLPSV